ncbi:CHAT domain-containing protein [Actinorhabdospora filicis]|uniref:CHAT domain-containing protein n=1 Tax=Actinorhabdospora filicis TaxID=1785913 RepID=UPI002556944B|nr:CHAT domain-containing protein [Actinorhabdospora filicis]
MLIEQLSQHIDALLAGSPERLSDERAMGIAEELRQRRITEPGQALGACIAIATLYFIQGAPSAENQRRSETVRTAAALFATIGPIAPEAIPAELRTLVKTDARVPRTAPERLDEMRDNAIDSRDPAALNLAAAILRATVSADSGGLAEVASLAEVLGARAERTRDIEDLDEAVAVGKIWLDKAATSDPARAFRLWRLGLAEFGRHIVLGDPAPLDQAVIHTRAAVNTASPDDPKLQSYLTDLGLGLHLRAAATRNAGDIDAAITGWHLALDRTPPGAPDGVAYQYNLGYMYWFRYAGSSDGTALDSAIDMWRVVANTPSGDHSRAESALPLLAEALQVRASRNGTLTDVDESIRVLRAGIDSGASRNDEATFAAVLGNALWTRHGITGDLGDLDQAVEETRKAIASTSAESSSLISRKAGLASFLVTRHRVTSDDHDLAEAVDLARATVATMPPGGEKSGLILSNAGDILRTLAERNGDLAGLEAATALLRRAVDVLAVTDFHRVATLGNLALALYRMAFWTGDVERIDTSIEVARDALRSATEGGPDQARVLANLAVALRTRYTFTGTTRDLDQALAAVEEALNRTPAAHPSRAQRLDVLASVQIEQHRRYATPGVLDTAIARARQAVDLTSPAHSYLASRYTTLGDALLLRFHRSGGGADLDEAVSSARAAVEATPDDDPLHAVMLVNLAHTLRNRVTVTHDPGDLDEVVLSARKALTELPDDSPYRTNACWALATALSERSEIADGEAFPPETIAMLTEASAVPAGAAPLRVKAAYIAARMLVHEGAESAALPLLRTAVELLPRLARRDLERRDQRHLLDAEVPILAMDAAACAIGVGDLPEAVRLLEHGRGVIWGQLLDRRSDRGALHEAYPDIAAELERCLTALDSVDRQTNPDSGLTRHTQRTGSSTARRLDELVAEIRALPATEAFPHPAEFMGSPRLEPLMPPPGTGPVVILNMSRWRCDALIVTEDEIAVVPLPFEQPEAAAVTTRYLDALRRNTGPVRDPELETRANRVLEWLWDHVAEPVLDHLAFTPGRTNPPRIWWCPTGPLALLPIHAAGYHPRGDGRTVLDRAVSSYVPSLRALAYARSRQVPDQRPSALLVSIPRTPGLAELPGVTREHRMFTECFGAEAVTTLTGVSATREAIIAGLGENAIVHVASHGVQNLTRPSDGGLVPYDWETAGLVRADDLAGTRGGPGGLAFLSACQTAIGGVVSLEESVNVAAAMHYAGWPHVIGTLWTIFDGAAAAIAERFYERVIHDGRADLSVSAYALHDAVLELRDRNPRDAAYWARFVHFGP